MSTASTGPDAAWGRFQHYLLRYEDLGFSLDISRMNFEPEFFDSMAPHCAKAFGALTELEGGAEVNVDEGRMVGHYWLRNPKLAPSAELTSQIEEELAEIKEFSAAVHAGEIAAPDGKKFSHLLLVGIGGSALGPQFIAQALGGPAAPMGISFFDNTDPDGMDRVLAEIGERLDETLTVVVSKSGGTAETRNGMLEAEAAYTARGLPFEKFAAAVTGVDSKLDRHAKTAGWIKRFPMSDWVGGRTSVMSVVGLLPAALQGVDIDAFLAGAAAMDEKTRNPAVMKNAAMLLALMWHHAGRGKGEKDMVILPYKDRLVLFSKYLQQLVMESLGKELDLDGQVVNQGIAVYGNKGSTDQHAYVQQLRDGVNNFFATFIEVRKARDAGSLEVEDGFTSGDYLQGFLRGTRSALSGNSRESIMISVPEVSPYYVGLLIALFERAVTFYASLVNINAYHQPGVEAGKKAAGDFLVLLAKVKTHLAENAGEAFTAVAVAEATSASPEEAFDILNHLSANDGTITRTPGGTPGEDTFAMN